MKNLLKATTLDVYNRLSAPWRNWMLKQLTTQQCAPITVLYYHRVADTNPVPWSLTNYQFAAHLDWLEKHFDFLSLAEVRQRIEYGKSDRPGVHITFDDGYAENCDQALPLLIERGIPCTYFVTLSNVLEGKPFEHDKERGFDFPVNSVDQLRDLSRQGIEIGAHTRTHPDLGKVSRLETIYDEVILAGRELSDAIDQPIRYFAFPFGMKHNLNESAVAMLKEEGYDCVVSAYGGYNFPGDDEFHLQRVHGDPELARLRNAAFFDPRHYFFRNRLALAGSQPQITRAKSFYRERNAQAEVAPEPAHSI